MATKAATKPQAAQSSAIAANRRAGFDYELMERFEAGIVLTGTEIKAIREGRVNVREAYVRVQNGHALLLNCHISQYQAGSYQNHEPTRPRALLLHKKEIVRLEDAVHQKGLTIVPTRMYFKRGMVKVEIALARGKKAHDRRDAVAKREAQRDIARAIRRSTL